MGGNDKQGFGMKQGVLTNQRVRLLMSPGQQCFRGHGRRTGEEQTRIRGGLGSGGCQNLHACHSVGHACESRNNNQWGMPDPATRMGKKGSVMTTKT